MNHSLYTCDEATYVKIGMVAVAFVTCFTVVANGLTSRTKQASASKTPVMIEEFAAPESNRLPIKPSGSVQKTNRPNIPPLQELKGVLPAERKKPSPYEELKQKLPPQTPWNYRRIVSLPSTPC